MSSGKEMLASIDKARHDALAAAAARPRSGSAASELDDDDVSGRASGRLPRASRALDELAELFSPPALQEQVESGRSAALQATHDQRALLAERSLEHEAARVHAAHAASLQRQLQEVREGADADDLAVGAAAAAETHLEVLGGVYVAYPFAPASPEGAATVSAASQPTLAAAIAAAAI